jgi:hypothetical protein
MLLSLNKHCIVVLKMLDVLVKVLRAAFQRLIFLINHHILDEQFIIVSKCLPARPYLPNGVIDLIGNTPMIRLPHLSELTGCTILVNCHWKKF